MTNNGPDDSSSTSSDNPPAEDNQGAGTTQTANVSSGSAQTGTTSSGTVQASTARVPFKPETPKFGGIERDEEHWIVWTGGKPKSDWSGLEEENPDSITDNQFRGTSVGSRSKRAVYRTQGLETKFTRKSDLQTMAKDIKMHFVEYGLDTMMYLNSPLDDNELVNVLEDHALFTLTEGVKLANETKNTHFDKYALQDDRDATRMLFNSVDEDIKQQLYENCHEDDSFTACWLHLVNIVCSTSLSRFDKVKDKLKARKLTDYAGENVEALATDYYKDYKSLHGARMYDHNLTTYMLDTILAGQTTDDLFKHDLVKLLSDLNDKLLETRHLSYADRQKEMAKHRLDVQSVLTTCKDKYRKAYDNQKWLAATHNKDSKALSRNFGRVNQAQVTSQVDQEATKTFKKLVNALVKQVGMDKEGAKKPTRNKDGKPQRGNPKRDGKRDPKKSMVSQMPAPKTGESEIKVINGSKRYWCGICNRWTMSHGTDGHKTKAQLEEERSKKKANMARVNFDFHPAAFFARKTEPMSDVQLLTTAVDTFCLLFAKMFTCVMVLVGLLDIILGSTAFEATKNIAWTDLIQLTWTDMLQKSSWLWYWVTSMTTNLLELIAMEWIAVTIAVLAGAIGFGAGAYLYSQTPDKPAKGRIRRGAAAIKQAKRKYKAKYRPSAWSRHKDKNTVKVPKNWLVRNSLTHHERFNNVGRNNCYESPRILRIRYLRRKIEELDERIHKLRAELHSAQSKRREYQRELDHLMKHPYTQPWPMASERLRKTFSDYFVERVKWGKSRWYRKVPPQVDEDGNEWIYGTDGWKMRHKPVPITSRRSRKMQSKKTKRRRQHKRSLPKQLEPEIKVPENNLWKKFYERVCCVASLVNLSAISSSNDEAGTNESVLFDSGANCCLTNSKADFCGDFEHSSSSQTIEGIGKGLCIKGHGTVAWTFLADNGMYRTLTLPCYYVPSIQQRVASLQVIMDVYHEESIKMTSSKMTLSGSGKNPPMTVEVHPTSRLHMAIPCPGPGHSESPGPATPRNKSKQSDKNYGTTLPRPVLATMSASSTNKKKGGGSTKAKKPPKPLLPTELHPVLTSPVNINLSEPEKELLRWHHRLGHVNMRRIQWLFRQGLLATSTAQRRLHQTAANLTHGPMCAACQYAKQRQRTTPGSVKKPIKSEENALKRDKLYPGQLVSIDHFDCKPSGRLVNTYGKEHEDNRYKGGCIFVDHASGTVFAGLQSSLNSHETLYAKELFEKIFCDHHGVVVQQYLSDNGTSFTSKAYTEHLSNFHQTIQHSAVGAHHSNGVAERNIGTLMSITRAMLHHAAIHWPEVADVGLWSLAVLYAQYILNHLPKADTGRSPIELFCHRTLPTCTLNDLHVWGCPVYVLDGTTSVETNCRVGSQDAPAGCLLE